MNTATRTFLFWMLMIFLAVVLWRVSMANRQPDERQELTYTDLIEEIAEDNVAEVTIETHPQGAEVDGTFRTPAARFRVTIARETIPHLTSLLLEKKVTVQFREGAGQADFATILINLAPILLFVGLWIFMIREMQKRKQGGQGPPGT